jgi:hypothetical protein
MNNIPNSPKHDHLAERVFERIQDEHLAPRPRWEFLFKNYALWGLGALAVALGALATSASLFEVQNVDWRLSLAAYPDFLSFFFASAPFIWVVAFALFVLVGYLNVRRTVHGYRYPFALILIGAVLLSLALGTAVYAMGFGGAVDEALGDHPPFYRPVLAGQRSLWVAPEKGLLAGKVTASEPSISSFTLQDYAGRDWKVDGDDLRNRDMTLVARGGDVRVVGVPSTATSTSFHACFVFPLETRGVNKKGPLPAPLAAVASTSGRQERSAECKGIRPYVELHAIEQEGD